MFFIDCIILKVYNSLRKVSNFLLLRKNAICIYMKVYIITLILSVFMKCINGDKIQQVNVSFIFMKNNFILLKQNLVTIKIICLLNFKQIFSIKFIDKFIIYLCYIANYT